MCSCLNISQNNSKEYNTGKFCYVLIMSYVCEKQKFGWSHRGGKAFSYQWFSFYMS